MMAKKSSTGLQVIVHSILDDYTVTDKVLGLGINGKVVECCHRISGHKYALKVRTHNLLPSFQCTHTARLLIETRFIAGTTRQSESAS
jgi:hypothetical protein